MSQIIEMTWDSAFFNKKVGKILMDNTESFDYNKFLIEARKYDLIYLISNNQLLPNNLVSKANLDLMDTILTMSKKINKDDYLSSNYRFLNELEGDDLTRSYQIAEEISVVSRFSREKLVGKEITKKLYRIWVDNALNKSYSDGLFLEKIDNKVVGIHLLKLDLINQICFFTLTGVSSLMKGKGIGNNLWNQSFAYLANETNIDLIKSPFSLNNLHSFNFHLKMGFDKIEEVKYIYHFRKE
ncbi:GNAT family N-acetyltransferase [Cecembia lonarensis]|uniref:TDP-fucosamine acetyltransferase n=1 Tax=Cecembia lonarensis (strain CCUG 58316 / KCTC 22772 / LW9) TaxID=1225176 RepID=K1LEE6_CECL9|nr:GNAT family N-acetyltransferase [Cecembia lonarensis]EKB48718.1 TDP-fucosamine acetyltransferase [Cecembia lonarensis LW9]